MPTHRNVSIYGIAYSFPTLFMQYLYNVHKPVALLSPKTVGLFWRKFSVIGTYRTSHLPFRFS